ncbi:unnamed protein product [Rotaria magnacalcarata]|uniref:Uncharacterized protein n=1 Tax=Rotaria magnacalcarata TaxID=392030 RepID=A0A815UJI0_9BILA|nr:unnamed protein product [Rotaria magnacalcarata]CAF1520322.1 unnamed protein product [Rotaria magnacalcarata]CAF2046875.1 unnamed protein product [Rotaria magnacalcarata]CAF3756224.1 unnamed protein product [Rotaria magnacalcarata]CAF3876349.1 unnamed protein product [Rotaria magnacalcarata]
MDLSDLLALDTSQRELLDNMSKDELINLSDESPPIDPFASSPSSSRSNSSAFVLDDHKVDILMLLMGDEFITNMNRDDFIDFYQSLTSDNWINLSTYATLAELIDSFSNVRRDQLNALDNDML